MSGISDVDIGYVNRILFAAEQAGSNRGIILEAADLDPTILEDTAARIPHEVQTIIWDEAARGSNDPYFGLHLAEIYFPDKFGLAGHVIRACSTLGSAFDRMSQYMHLVHRGVEFSMDILDDRICLTQKMTVPPWITSRHAAEHAMATIYIESKRLSRQLFDPLKVSFQHAAPADLIEYQRIFGCPLVFGSSRNEIQFDLDVYDMPVRSAHAEKLAYYEAIADSVLNSLKPVDDFIMLARKAVFDSIITCNGSMAEVANKMDMSIKELRKGLNERGVSFRLMSSAMKRHMALTYLEDKSWSLADVAFVLGFGNTSSFNRAFKSWTGDTPAEYRRSIFDQ